MRIAVTHENGQIFQHFGRSEQFKVYELEGEKIVSSKIVGTNGKGHGSLIGFLSELGVDALICGGIGGGARNGLVDSGIELYAGVAGNADAAVEQLLSGSLQFSTNANCDHHDHDHHESCHGHDSGGHSCH
ncbi:MAG: dinitrogenase iron-molybdenum cofactor biosynthesis protein [Coriobacteriaceae bacterium]|nr:dinitrogenase iron-molybdenum cofactor biosynthesis protein [Coriobacteriaceae bacterium]